MFVRSEVSQSQATIPAELVDVGEQQRVDNPCHIGAGPHLAQGVEPSGSHYFFA